jgi:orotidine-5'-phosphate decarboxylase
MQQNPVIVALDVPRAEKALELARQLTGVVGAFKIGSELFTTAGPEIVRKIREMGGAVFLDLKFHDIPNTVAKAVAAAVRLDVQMLTVHTSGGGAMLRAAAAAARETAQAIGCAPPLVLGVTVLTSFESGDLAEIGLEPDARTQVERLAKVAVAAGIHGLVCSPMEVVPLRRVLPVDVQLVTPGIRAGGDAANDQKRTLSADEALVAGSNWLVIGRPIYAAENPRVAAEKILASISRSPANRQAG